jgi:hypothetical protein
MFDCAVLALAHHGCTDQNDRSRPRRFLQAAKSGN